MFSTSHTHPHIAAAGFHVLKETKKKTRRMLSAVNVKPSQPQTARGFGTVAAFLTTTPNSYCLLHECPHRRRLMKCAHDGPTRARPTMSGKGKKKKNQLEEIWPSHIPLSPGSQVRSLRHDKSCLLLPTRFSLLGSSCTLFFFLVQRDSG